MTARAVVVDDDELAREAVVAGLSGTHAVEVVGICATRDEALEVLCRECPDLLFLDIHLGGGDGFEVLDGISGICEPAVVFVTGDENQALRAFGVAAVDYVVKPFTEARLLAAAHRALDRRALGGAREPGNSTL